MATALNIAKYLLSLSDSDAGDLISNLKLQKLLYYSQGASLAIRDEPLFADAIIAWEHGPVVPSVWQSFRENGSNAIEPSEDFDESTVSTDEKDIVREVYEVFGQFSAWKLRNMTHNEPPWSETDQNQEISIPRLKAYFTTLLVDG